jgi:ferredoxin
MGDALVTRGEARHVSLEEACEILRRANESGLVHLSLYMPDHRVYALCSCCPCCCHDLQIIRLYERQDLIVRSEYVAVTDFEVCTGCRACIGRCSFDARVERDGRMVYDQQACVGCGLCVTVCPVDATSMAVRGSSSE